jgi:hypothetical protein
MLKKLISFFTASKRTECGVSQEELVRHIEQYPDGIPRFMAAMRSSGPIPEESVVVCSVTQKRYRLADNYKVELQAVDDGFENRALYIYDLLTLIRQGQIRLVYI